MTGHSLRVPAVLSVDWTQVGQPAYRLRVRRSTHGATRGMWEAIADHHGGAVYMRSDNLDTVVRFMRAFAEKHAAELDEQSIELERERLSRRVGRTAAPALAPVIPFPTRKDAA